MYSSILLIVFIKTIIKFEFSDSVKQWIENPEFQDPKIWENGKFPCSLDKIVFPKSFSSAIFSPVTLKTNGIVFPEDGVILLHSNSNISFSNFDNNDKNKNKKVCVNKNYLAKMKNPKKRNWFNPNNWKEISSNIKQRNPAIPHVQRIPCSNEKVIINLNGALSIDLDYVDELYLGGLQIAQKDFTAEQLQSFLQTDVGQSMFKNAELTDIIFLTEPICGCHKSEFVEKYQRKVCRFAKNTCEIPKCLNPITPMGHCCKVCGSTVKLYIENCTDFNMNLFKKQLDKALQSEDELVNNVYIDYRIITSEDDKFLQLVILDKNEYTEKSVQLMNTLEETLLNDYYENTRKVFYMSGLPYTTGATSSGWIFMLISLLCVLFVFLVLVTHFMPELLPVTLPTWLYPSRYQVLNSPFVFARFDNNQPDVEISARPINVNNPEPENADITSSARGTTSFNNPMFDENAEKSDTQESGGPLENELSEIELNENKEK